MTALICQLVYFPRKSGENWSATIVNSSVKKLLSVFLLTLGAGAVAFAGGIYVGSPLVSGEASVFRDNLGTERMSLSSDQLQAMAHWLEQRPSAWQGDPIEASPNERVELQIKLNHATDGVTTLSVIPGVRGGHFLRLTGPGTWAYHSLFGLYKTWAATRQITEQELGTLKNMIGITR
jgi:hypothetical protein